MITETQAKNTHYNGTAAVWYTSHHAITERDWRNIREFDGPHHPMLGYYRSDDPAVLRQHLHWLRRAGIDAIVYDMYGAKDMTLLDIPRDPTLPLLVDALAHQENESRQLKLIIWLEKYYTNPSLEEYRYALDYVKEHLANQPFYFHYRGKPLIVTYLNGDNTAIDEIEWENDFFSLRRIRPYHSDVWSYVEHYPQRLSRQWMVASPGFDPYLELAYLARYYHGEANPDYAKIKAESRSAAAGREDGVYFTKQLLRARYGNPEFIFISGWNDWQYANQIEPAVEYGFQYVDLTARLLGRQDETAPYRSDGR
jgi:hypothetical protein